ncbi:MAG TPA: protein-S-isoprenylcysteine methyltransferase [Allosphingosinicella sp.]|jgi:protein-S-isoprenylcysteine O-methyltransferase Ste14
MNAELKIAPGLRREDRPRSAVSTMVGVVGLAGLLTWLGIARAFEFSGPHAALCAVAACGGPMILWSLLVDKVHRNPGNGIDWASPPRPLSDSLDYSIVKIAALWATWAAIAFLYCMARWYWDNRYGDTLFAMKTFGFAAAPLLVLSVPYVVSMDRRLKDPRDGAWHFGQLLIGKSSLVSRPILFDYFRCWAIKAFFLAFMVSIVPGNWFDAVTPRGPDIVRNIVTLTHWLIAVMFMIDVCMATIGYVLTLKPLDAHIRSANPYAAGWTAALICYPPIILMSQNGPLDYHIANADWSYWLDGYPLAMTLVAFLLVLLTGFYAWATVAFGLRFSNLTHRGILTHGPYAWTKHPAYVSKNLFWWLADLPFLATNGDMTDMVRNTFVLGLVSGVYYWRARTEERHLAADPAYRDYADWMARNGPVTRLLARLSPRRLDGPLPAE